MRKILVRDRLKWKAKLYKALQRALRDIRGYTYCDSGSGFRWIPNNRQSEAAPRNPSNDENRITDDEFENELEFHYYNSPFSTVEKKICISPNSRFAPLCNRKVMTVWGDICSECTQDSL